LKLAPLLAQYLYRQRKLELAGIGIFFLDTTARVTTDSQHLSEGISFEYRASPPEEDDGLVSYISSETGKMKSLASSDLNSYLELAREFLNIGKPFQIEGIGTLVKNKSGELEFTADHMLSDKGRDTGMKELSATSISDGSLTTYETLKPKSEQSPGSRKVFLSFLAVATVVFIVWISYRTYKGGSARSSQQASETLPVRDTSKYISASADTVAEDRRQSIAPNSGSYRFVIEVANKRRAYYRYNLLRQTNVPIQISTSDSVNYKLFFMLPATAADTARIVDSLSTWYPALNHRKAFAEK